MKAENRGCACISHVSSFPSIKMGRLRLKVLAGAKQLPATGVMHVRLPPHSRHDLIYHRRTREWFMVLKGKGRGIIGGRRVAFKPGVVVYMPPGVPHQMMTDASEMEALVVFSPPLRLTGPGADIHRAD